MEELWKKHKEEIKRHLSKIENFLQTELNNNDTFNINENSREKIIENDIQQIQDNIVLDENIKISDEFKMKTKVKKKKGRPRSPRREIYGKLRDTVKHLMEKENLSRAQAYRRAKKMHDKK